MYGWTGKLLEIDLGKKLSTILSPATAYYQKHLGGKGIAGQILMHHITKPWDHPEMALVFAAGPLVATPAPTARRLVVASKSPLTGTVGDASVGGRLGFQIKKAGCSRCRILCKKKDAHGSVLPEYETMSHFHALLENRDMDVVMAANRICNDLGMDTISHEILRKPVATDRFTFSGKARITKIAEDLNAVVDSLTACKFIFFGASPEEYARALYGVTGL